MSRTGGGSPPREGEQQRPPHQEPLRVQLVFGRYRQVTVPGLGGAQVEQLAAVVPLVDRLGHVDALVALQAQQFAAGPRATAPWPPRSCPTPASPSRSSGRWSVEREEDGGGQPFVGQVPGRGEPRRDVLRGHAGAQPTDAPAADLLEGRRVSTVASAGGTRRGVEVAGGSRPSAATAAASAARRAAGTAASTAAARIGVDAMLTRATPPPRRRADGGDTDDGPVLGPAVELLERPAGPAHLRHPDLGQHLVGAERGLEEADEEVRRRRSCGCPPGPERPGWRRGRARRPAGPTPGRRGRSSRRSSRGGGPGGRRPGRRRTAAAGTSARNRSERSHVVVAGEGADRDVVAVRRGCTRGRGRRPTSTGSTARRGAAS